jgi:hypothetical protein
MLQDLTSRLPQGDGCSYRSLKLYRQFYTAYPQFGLTLSAHLPEGIPSLDTPKRKGDQKKEESLPNIDDTLNCEY